MNPSRDEPVRWATMYKGPNGWHFAVLETTQATGKGAQVVEISPPLDRFSAADLLTTYIEDQLVPTAD